MTYGKIILIGFFALTGILLNNFYSPNRYTHKEGPSEIRRFDSLDGSVEVLLSEYREEGWISLEKSK